MPTGSGKSTCIAALGLSDLLKGRANKHWVTVPQSIIANSFTKKLKIRLPDGTVVSWLPGHRLIDASDTIGRIRNFLTTPLGLTRLNPERILISSHAALVAYHERYADDPYYEGVSLAIDEAHHSCYGEETDDDRSLNRLGGLIRHWLDCNCGPLTTATATWYRSDRIPSIPPDRYDDFTCYTLSFADYLDGMTYLKEIEIRFLVGDPYDCIKQCHDEDPDANTIIYVRPVGSGRDKYAELARLQDLLGSCGIPDDQIVDLVTDEPRVREAAKRELFRSIEDGEWDLTRKGTDAAQKLYVLALMLGREGFDLQQLQRSTVISPRSSMAVIQQILGRLTRDYPGKARVQFNIILPFTDADMVNGELIRGYTKSMMAALVLGCNISPPKLTCSEDRDTLDKLMGNGGSRALYGLSAIVAEAPEEPVSDLSETVARALERLDLGKDIDRASAERVFRAMLIRQAELQLLAHLPDPDLEQDVFGQIRAWRLAFGHKSLAELNRIVGNASTFTWESAAKLVLAEKGPESAVYAASTDTE